jgi:hypothetical protein
VLDVPSPEEGWFIAAMGGFAWLIAKRVARELSEKLVEPGESPERTAAYFKWHVFMCRLIGSVTLGYGGWLRLFSKG